MSSIHTHEQVKRLEYLGAGCTETRTSSSEREVPRIIPGIDSNYVKLLGAGICFVLSLFNVLGAMQRVPIKTSVGDSSRPAVAMMKSPGANLNWLSGGVFFAASIGLIGWAIWDYNSNVDLGIDGGSVNIPSVTPPVAPSDIQMPQYPGEMESNKIEITRLQGGTKPLNKNIIPFRRTADGSVPITPEQFKSVLEEEDYWTDK